MIDLLGRMWEEIMARPDGPLALRFYLQPLMAALFALRDGKKDADTGQPPYFWSLFTEPAERAQLIRSGWRSVGKIFIIAIVLDVIYQFVVLKGPRPLETLIVATLLAIVPYVLLRGPFNRILRSRRRAA
jgi:hypothetical protein